jgi:hypothetical protein
VQGVEQALIQQIVKAVDAPYLAALRDRNSNSLQGTVHQILTHLQDIYGRVTPQMLEDREAELRNMTYNPKYPIDIVFNAVSDYSDFADLGNQPMTQRQTVAKAYLILNKTRRFKNDITEWNRKPDIQKNWVNFKDHFRRAHQEFRETTDTTLEESELQRNNANLVQQVVEGLQQAIPPPDDNSDLREQTANHTTRTSDTQQQLMTQMTQMQQSMSLLQAQIAANQKQHAQVPAPPQPFFQQQQLQAPAQQQPFFPYAPRGGGRGGFGNSGRGGRGRGRNSYRQRNTSIYCWTRGGCGHTSSQCTNKLPGHQDTATFTNKMGGNTNNCPP